MTMKEVALIGKLIKERLKEIEHSGDYYEEERSQLKAILSGGITELSVSDADVVYGIIERKVEKCRKKLKEAKEQFNKFTHVCKNDVDTFGTECASGSIANIEKRLGEVATNIALLKGYSDDLESSTKDYEAYKKLLKIKFY